MKTFKTSIVLGGVFLMGVIGVAGFIYSGIYPMGADSPHWAFTTKVIETLRDQSVKRASASLTVPNLDNPENIASGAQDFNDMCTGCHLTPTLQSSDLSTGLYPKPPNLFKRIQHNPKADFWVIKHGLKMSGMPEWGSSHDDQRIWAMVAFLKHYPELNAEEYAILSASELGGNMNMEMQHDSK